jgi:N,N'-diacetyllegionaminate synthase
MKSSVFIIAEIGSVHDGSFGNAVQAVHLAKECGADAVKYQLHIAEAETLRNAPSPSFFTSESRWDYFNRTGFSSTQWHELKNLCDKVGIEFMVSPFSEAAVDILANLGMRRWKVPSGEVTNLPLLARISAKGGPILLSSGMSDWSELDLAVNAIREAGAADRLTVLQCTSEYPCAPEHVGINVMEEMASRYGVPVGLSDHTSDIFAPVVAVARGGSVIEKHLTFSRKMYGSDAQNSLEPEEFRRMVQGIRETEILISSRLNKNIVDHISEMKIIFEKSIVARRLLARGTVMTKEDLNFKKPGTGISAARWEELVGRRLKRDKPEDEMILAEDLE